MSIKHRLLEVKQFLAEKKIERMAFLLANWNVSGDFPGDITEKELSEIAMWDAITRRAGALVEAAQKAQGVTGVIGKEALEPRGNDGED